MKRFNGHLTNTLQDNISHGQTPVAKIKVNGNILFDIIADSNQFGMNFY